MEFAADELSHWRWFSFLALIDDHGSDILAIEVETRFDGDDVVRALERETTSREEPRSIHVGNGSYFVSKSLDCWAYFNDVRLEFNFVWQAPGQFVP